MERKDETDVRIDFNVLWKHVFVLLFESNPPADTKDVKSLIVRLLNPSDNSIVNGLILISKALESLGEDSATFSQNINTLDEKSLIQRIIDQTNELLSVGSYEQDVNHICNFHTLEIMDRLLLNDKKEQSSKNSCKTLTESIKRAIDSDEGGPYLTDAEIAKAFGTIYSTMYKTQPRFLILLHNLKLATAPFHFKNLQDVYNVFRKNNKSEIVAFYRGVVDAFSNVQAACGKMYPLLFRELYMTSLYLRNQNEMKEENNILLNENIELKNHISMAEKERDQTISENQQMRGTLNEREAEYKIQIQILTNQLRDTTTEYENFIRELQIKNGGVDMLKVNLSLANKLNLELNTRLEQFESVPKEEKEAQLKKAQAESKIFEEIMSKNKQLEENVKILNFQLESLKKQILESDMKYQRGRRALSEGLSNTLTEQKEEHDKITKEYEKKTTFYLNMITGLKTELIALKDGNNAELVERGNHQDFIAKIIAQVKEVSATAKFYQAETKCDRENYQSKVNDYEKLNEALALDLASVMHKNAVVTLAKITCETKNEALQLALKALNTKGTEEQKIIYQELGKLFKNENEELAFKIEELNDEIKTLKNENDALERSKAVYRIYYKTQLQAFVDADQDLRASLKSSDADSAYALVSSMFHINNKLQQDIENKTFDEQLTGKIHRLENDFGALQEKYSEEKKKTIDLKSLKAELERLQTLNKKLEESLQTCYDKKSLMISLEQDAQTRAQFQGFFDENEKMRVELLATTRQFESLTIEFKTCQEALKTNQKALENLGKQLANEKKEKSITSTENNQLKDENKAFQELLIQRLNELSRFENIENQLKSSQEAVSRLTGINKQATDPSQRDNERSETLKILVKEETKLIRSQLQQCEAELDKRDSNIAQITKSNRFFQKQLEACRQEFQEYKTSCKEYEKDMKNRVDKHIMTIEFQKKTINDLLTTETKEDFVKKIQKYYTQVQDLLKENQELASKLEAEESCKIKIEEQRLLLEHVAGEFRKMIEYFEKIRDTALVSDAWDISKEALDRFKSEK